MLALSQPRFSISISSPEAHHHQRLSTCGRAKEKLHRYLPEILEHTLRSFPRVPLCTKDETSWIKLDVIKIWRTDTLCVSVSAAQDTRRKEGGEIQRCLITHQNTKSHIKHLHRKDTDTKQHFNTNLHRSKHLKYNGTSCHTLEGTWCSWKLIWDEYLLKIWNRPTFWS